jgi:hypothetical protein
MDINVYFQLKTKNDPFYFHAAMLNMTSVGCLSLGFQVKGEDEKDLRQQELSSSLIGLRTSGPVEERPTQGEVGPFYYIFV